MAIFVPKKASQIKTTPPVGFTGLNQQALNDELAGLVAPLTTNQPLGVIGCVAATENPGNLLTFSEWVNAGGPLSGQYWMWTHLG